MPFRPGAAAGVCLTIGFVGALVGITYAWPAVIDRLWLVLWSVAAGGLAGRWALEWYRRTVLPAQSRTLDMNNLLASSGSQESHSGEVVNDAETRSSQSPPECGEPQTRV